MSDDPSVIALIGGTGALGTAIARRLALDGRQVIVGSRDCVRASEAAERLSADLQRPLRGTSNLEAAQAAAIVIVAVPFASQRQSRA